MFIFQDCYSDATILCYGKLYPVHSFVLSTCSEYFEEIFKQCRRLNNRHPFIVVTDIHPEQMEALLNYMYKGEVNVPQEMLPELIKAAEAVKMKGLAVSDEDIHKPTGTRKRTATPTIPETLPKCKKQEEKQISTNENTDNLASQSSSNDSGVIESDMKSVESGNKVKTEKIDNEGSEIPVSIVYRVIHDLSFPPPLAQLKLHGVLM